MLKKLLKSKTIWGIVVAALSGGANYFDTAIMPGLMADYGQYITPALMLLQAAGLSWATFGRIVAKGPLKDVLPTAGTK